MSLDISVSGGVVGAMSRARRDVCLTTGRVFRDVMAQDWKGKRDLSKLLPSILAHSRWKPLDCWYPPVEAREVRDDTCLTT
jgi:hypothetical protein